MPVPPRRRPATPSARTVAPVEPLESRQLLSAGFHPAREDVAPRPIRADFGRVAVDAPAGDRSARDSHRISDASRDPFQRPTPDAGRFNPVRETAQGRWSQIPAAADPMPARDDSASEPVVHVPAGSAQRPGPSGSDLAGDRPVALYVDGGTDSHVLAPTFERASGPVFVLPRPVGPTLEIAVVRVTPVAALAQPRATEQQAQRADSPATGPVAAPARAAPADVRTAAQPQIPDASGAPAVASSATAAMARGALAAIASDAPVISGAVSAAARAAVTAAQSVMPAAARLILGATPFALSDQAGADSTPAPVPAASAATHALASVIEGAVTTAVAHEVRAAAHAGEVMIAGVETAAVALPRTFLYFPRIDAVANFNDAMAAFIDDSAAPAATAAHDRSRAWTITAAVIAADVALLVYWHRSGKKNKAPAAIPARPGRAFTAPA